MRCGECEVSGPLKNFRWPVLTVMASINCWEAAKGSAVWRKREEVREATFSCLWLLILQPQNIPARPLFGL